MNQKQCIFLLLFLNILHISAQTAISGHTSLEEDGKWEQKIYLSKISLEEGENRLQSVAWSPIAKDGSFSFKGKHISDKDAIYRLYVNPIKKVISDTVAHTTDFILSKSDKIYFPKSKKLLGKYRSSSPADAEWQKMQKFQWALEKEKNTEDTISEAYAAKLKSYTKDSLKILLVKLIGIDQLAKKGLLDKDIAENPNYYLALLAELEESDMQPAEYRFLSRRLAYLTQKVVVQKYQWSKAIILILVIITVVLSLFVYRLKRKQNALVANLSRQEQNIRALILEGKSNKEIANELFISLSTVKTHITNIYSKLKVANRKELLERYQV
ncbi:LuxR C-terminal-related transcriptional regulator [Costertonia aggregata]|uniref:Response regulator transcription factor n=1 Tax=Costertonia aggregata TaxID=343403 RepID=A0A7H9ALV7_9FLAO|nr:LuxR C-terminal-related transcriptional regulator [Costertonia aggregata]QLG44440.1 response regulator transcription factor [Costertonia aggregata]